MPDFDAATELNDWCLEDSPCTRNGALARSWEARSLPLDDIALRNCFAGGQRDPQSETVPVKPRNTHLPPLKGGGGISTPSDLRGSRRVCDPAGEAVTMRKQAATCQRPQRAAKTGDSQQRIAKPLLPPCAGSRALLPPQMRCLLFAADWSAHLVSHRAHRVRLARPRDSDRPAETAFAQRGTKAAPASRYLVLHH